MSQVPEDLFYNAEHAQSDHDQKKLCCGTPSKGTVALLKGIDGYLCQKWSPAQIAHQIEVIIGATICRWVNAGKLSMTRKSLRFSWRKRHGNERRGTMKVNHVIAERPQSINSSHDFRHWKVDTVLSGRNYSNVCEATS